MNKIERPTMTVLVNGVKEIREISHMAQDEILPLGHPAATLSRAVPVLAEGEAVLHVLSGGPPHIIKGFWPKPLRFKPKDFQHQYGQTFTEVDEDA